MAAFDPKLPLAAKVLLPIRLSGNVAVVPLRSCFGASAWVDRSDDREPTSFPAFVVRPGGNKLPVTVTNVSNDGCQVQCEQLLPIGETVELEAGDRRVAADVRWS